LGRGFGTNTFHTKQEVEHVMPVNLYVSMSIFSITLAGSFSVCSIVRSGNHVEKRKLSPLDRSCLELAEVLINIDKLVFVGCTWNGGLRYTKNQCKVPNRLGDVFHSKVSNKDNDLNTRTSCAAERSSSWRGLSMGLRRAF
jgi:hypothetical protein